MFLAFAETIVAGLDVPLRLPSLGLRKLRHIVGLEVHPVGPHYHIHRCFQAAPPADRCLLPWMVQFVRLAAPRSLAPSATRLAAAREKGLLQHLQRGKRAALKVPQRHDQSKTRQPSPHNCENSGQGLTGSFLIFGNNFCQSWSACRGCPQRLGPQIYRVCVQYMQI